MQKKYQKKLCTNEIMCTFDDLLYKSRYFRAYIFSDTFFQVLEINATSIKMYHFIDVPASICTILQMYQHQDVPFYGCISINMNHFIVVPASRCTILQMYQHQDVPLYRCTSIKMYHSIDIPASRCTILQMYQHQDVPFYR